MKYAFLNTASALCFVGSMLVQPAALAAQELPPLPKALKDAGVIRIGVKCDSPPFGFSGPDGKPVGIEVEMAKQIGVYAFGSADKAVLSCVSSDARIPALNGGKIDAVLATLGKTQARAEVIDFTHSYYWGTSTVIVAKDSKVQKLADFEGETVIVLKGGSQAKWFRDNMPNVDLMQLNTAADSVQALVQGRGEGYSADGEVIATVSGNYPQLRVVEEGFDLGANGIGLRKNEPELKAFLDAAIKKMKTDKFHASVVKKFVDSPALQAKMVQNYETDAPPEAEMRK
ncbi:transporter substrate-binding domain-containing protein [Neorhizobium galegae]|uniref:transporter substrate-binding domain-containing protein n=1 Tax=Neorhizobium galegae TaxID=399 RepID=UPI0006217674|nr:transporter substrate-binding domain-containing protein [Neorhizobium galegae]CDZ55168.1 Surface antigen, CjaA [Neorhizobium galegae bv. orientalis]